VKPPRPQFTLREMMGLVALCAVGFALLMTSVAPLGVGVLVIIPGFVLERARGGTGIIGGMISGCLLPTVVWFPAAVIELYLSRSPIAKYLDLLPALYLLLVICLVWSGVACGLLYAVERRLQGPSRRNELASPSADRGIRFLSNNREGIRFLPEDTRPGGVPPAASPQGASAPVPRRGPD
jgi:hypothetical protein